MWFLFLFFYIFLSLFISLQFSSTMVFVSMQPLLLCHRHTSNPLTFSYAPTSSRSDLIEGLREETHSQRHFIRQRWLGRSYIETLATLPKRRRKYSAPTKGWSIVPAPPKMMLTGRSHDTADKHPTRNFPRKTSNWIIVSPRLRLSRRESPTSRLAP